MSKTFITFAYMKNVNLTGLYLAMVAKFGVTGFELSSLVPQSGEPIDMLITFNGGDIENLDKFTVLFDVDEIIRQNMTGDLQTIRTKINEGKIQIYLESLGEHSTHWDN
jgi:hypothetical protein